MMIASAALPHSGSGRVRLFVLMCLLCFGTQGVGWLLTAAAVRDWYPELLKPSWTPPDWLFGPVWTILFLLMAVSAWDFCGHAHGRVFSLGMGLFFSQLVLNALWSGLFFALRNPGMGFAEILLLWAAIASTLVVFWRVSTLAGVLLLPYLLWVTYATALNSAIWMLNT